MFLSFRVLKKAVSGRACSVQYATIRGLTCVRRSSARTLSLILARDDDVGGEER
jgi:hypothetical protein